MANPRTYIRTHSLDDVSVALKQHNDAYLLAGGALALGMLDVPYETVIDVSRVPELSAVTSDGQMVMLGGATMLSSVIDSDMVASPFKRSITRTVPVNIRNNTSVMETLTAPRPPLEWLTALAACDVTLTTMVSDETAEMPMSETHWVAGTEGDLLAGKLIQSVQLPLLGAQAGLGLAHIARTPAGDPLICAAVAVHLSASGDVEQAYAALAGTSVEQTLTLLPMNSLIGKVLTPETIEVQAAQVPQALNPPDDYLGSADYRRQMAQVLVRRALVDAMDQLSKAKAN